MGYSQVRPGAQRAAGIETSTAPGWRAVLWAGLRSVCGLRCPMDSHRPLRGGDWGLQISPGETEAVQSHAVIRGGAKVPFEG